MGRKNRNRKPLTVNKVKNVRYKAEYLDIAQLQKRCFAKISDFFCEGTVTNTANGPLIFKDNGSKILAVAHLDTVQHSKVFNVVQDRNGLTRLNNLQLDDRLGAHIIIDVLPKFGITVDVLLTTGEERGMSTASELDKSVVDYSKYNWIIEFDRRGIDVATYQYGDKTTKELLSKYGVQDMYGIYSDICDIDFVGVKGFNWGVGYYDNHSHTSHCLLEETEYMIEVFIDFYADMKDTRLEHVYSPTYCRSTGYWSGGFTSPKRPTYTSYKPSNDRYKDYILEIEALEALRKYEETVDGELSDNAKQFFMDEYISYKKTKRTHTGTCEMIDFQDDYEPAFDPRYLEQTYNETGFDIVDEEDELTLVDEEPSSRLEESDAGYDYYPYEKPM